MGALPNRHYPDEMPHCVAFCQGVHCLLGQNRPQRKEYYIACGFIEKSIGLKSVRLNSTLYKV